MGKIDISALHIGSHVLVDGKRVRICGITRRKVGYHHPDERPNAHLRYARLDEVKPIAITPALLEELGFECKHSPFSDEYEKRWGKGDVFDKENYLAFSQIRDEMWRVQLYTKGTFYNGQTTCRYLHKAEAFLSLHNIELIEDK